MKLHSIVLAAALATTAGAASAANYVIDLKGGPVTWSSDIDVFAQAGAFSDTFTFTNYTAAAGSATVGLINVSNLVTDIDFTSVTLNGVNALIDNGFVSTANLGNVAVSGPLTLVVNGFVTADADTRVGYGGSLSVTAVPEPATYGMLLGGMAVLGFAARRRKQD